MIAHSSSCVRPEDFAYIENLARSNFVGRGELSEKFRSRLCRVLGRSRSLLTSSGTAALEIALCCLRRNRPGKVRVAVSAYVCPSVVSAIDREGLKPLFVDVRHDSMGLDVASILSSGGGDILAVICTNIGGIPDDYDAVEAVGCEIISDCAQSLGATLWGKPLTALGKWTVLSFGSTKMITAGTGGALLTDGDSDADEAERYSASELPSETYRDDGFRSTYCQSFPDLNAGLGLSQLAELDDFIIRRRAVASAYDGVLIGEGGLSRAWAPAGANGSAYRYYFLSDFSAEWIRLFRENGVDARASIAHNMTEYFRGLSPLPNLSDNVRRVVSIPIHPALDDEDVNHIIQVLRIGVSRKLR